MKFSFDGVLLTRLAHQGHEDGQRPTISGLGQTLIELGLVSEDEDYQGDRPSNLALNISTLMPKPISESTLKLIPEELMKKHQILPLGTNNGKLKLAISDPLDFDTLDLQYDFGLILNSNVILPAPQNRALLIARPIELKAVSTLLRAELTDAGHYY